MTQEQSIRYSRQTAIPEIGKEGQERLLKSKVFIVGSGALGSMVAMQLAGAGIGVLGIADYDTIDISNLQRQFFFTTAEAGESKVEVLKKRILELNPTTIINEFNEMVTPSKGSRLFADYDIIVDGTDNPDSKRMIGEICKEIGKPCIIGGVSNFHGQVMTVLPGDSKFEEYFGNVGAEGFLPCSLGGVIGPAAALCASIQAAEVIKYLSGISEEKTSKLFTFDLLNNTFRNFT